MAIEGAWIGMGLSVGAAVAGGWWFMRRYAQARHLLDTPTSKIRSAAQGYVEFYGVLQACAGAEVIAPLTGKPCQWWRFRIEEYVGDDNKKSWRPVESGVSDSWLQLSDGTGECLINPQGAEVRPVTREIWKGSLRHPRGPQKSGLTAFLSMGKRYRYIEERLHVGQPLYAIGDFRSSGGGRQGLDLQRRQAEVIRHWKSDFGGLLQRFDSDGNGQLDEQEWNRVRLAAQLEAEDLHRADSLKPDQHHMAKPLESQPFILSCAGEDELARQLYWQAAAGAAVCIAGALGFAWILGN
ncbi:RING-type E3 ubiquitin transferase [Pseudomonas marincola]|uniref:RING-type E3 ubiquitin transferase n=1 Tax=Pseudomonas marincola TaxID=437900 RepID=A0A653E508_9PSED|nr:RING-type E3 ubiquitin transferase [Pseudomonas marincola]